MNHVRALGVRCKGCGHLFATGILYGVYGRPVVGPSALPCPACHRSASYSGEDYVAVRIRLTM